jgi:ribosome-associated protein
MKPEELIIRNFENEFVYSSSRSSGPGGQNINKLNTKVELRFNINKTSLLSDEEKEMLCRKLPNKINGEGELILIAQSERTQLMNKKIVTEKFYYLVSKALTSPPKRRSTRPTTASKIKRLERKKKHGYIKKLRNQAEEQSNS